MMFCCWCLVLILRDFVLTTLDVGLEWTTLAVRTTGTVATATAGAAAAYKMLRFGRASTCCWPANTQATKTTTHAIEIMLFMIFSWFFTEISANLRIEIIFHLTSTINNWLVSEMKREANGFKQLVSIPFAWAKKPNSKGARFFSSLCFSFLASLLFICITLLLLLLLLASIAQVEKAAWRQSEGMEAVFATWAKSGGKETTKRLVCYHVASKSIAVACTWRKRVTKLSEKKNCWNVLC